MGTKIIEGCWDCPCGNKMINGRVRKCTACGAQRADGTRFYIPSSGDEYLSESEAKTACKNPDWKCSFCGILNSDESNTCDGCGALKGESEENYFQMKEREEARKIEKEQSIANRSNNGYTKLSGNVYLAKRLAITAGILLSIASITLLIVYLMPKEKVVGVLSTRWVCTQEVKELKEVYEDSWELPETARLVKTELEVHHYNSVIDHYETKTRQVPHQVITEYKTVKQKNRLR